MTTDDKQQGYAGQMALADQASEFGSIAFLVSQMIARVSTMKIVKVMKVTASGLQPVGFLDAMPMVNMTDGLGNATPHATIYNLPYFRLQGGANAVIIDPKVGDLGLAVFADRDISAVKSAKAQANPGSKRKYDPADGVYIGGILNGAVQRYIWIKDDGIHSKGTWTHEGDIKVIGDVVSVQDVNNTAPISVRYHTHPRS